MKMQDAAKRIGAVVVAGGLALTLAGPALADTTTPTTTPAPRASLSASLIDHPKQACEAAIARRVVTLGELQTKVSANGNLTASDKATLTTQLTDEKAGLATLRVKIAADTDLLGLRQDCRDIVTKFRVYLLMAPKVHLVIAADSTVQVAQKLTDVVVKLQAAMDRAKAAGKNVTAAQSDLNAMKAAIAAGLAAAAPVPGLVLPLQPMDYPGNRTTLQTARQDIKTAHDHFVDARKDASKVRADLKGLRSPATPTSTAS